MYYLIKSQLQNWRGKSIFLITTTRSREIFGLYGIISFEAENRYYRH